MPAPRVIPPGPAPRPTAPIPSRFRAVSADRVVGFMRQSGDLQVHVVMQLAGHVDEARIARALRLRAAPISETGLAAAGTLTRPPRRDRAAPGQLGRWDVYTARLPVR